MDKRKVLVPAMLFLMGLIPLLNSINNPRLAGLRVPDYLRLIAVGMCFGVGLGFLFGGMRKDR